MLYKKINLDLIVPADEADAVMTELGNALDRIEKRYTLFGGGTETSLLSTLAPEKIGVISYVNCR